MAGIYKVDLTTGKAQTGLKVGDQVVTKGGTYVIRNVNADGTYKTNVVDKNITTNNYKGKYDNGNQDTSAALTPDTPETPTTPSTPSGAMNYPTVTNTDTMSSNNSAEIQDMIKQLSDASRATKLAGLEKAYNNSISNLDTAKAGVSDTYYGKRNQAAATSEVGAQNFAQYMAARGIKGNAGGMPEIYRNAALQSQVGSLDQQEAQANTDIENQRTALKNNYESDVAAVKSSADSEYLSNTINQMNSDRSYDFDMKKYLDDQLANQKTEFANTIGAYSGDYQKKINEVQNDGDTSNDWEIAYLQAARNEKIASIAANQQAAQEKAAALQTTAEQTNFQNALNIFKSSGRVSSQWVADALGLPLGSTTAEYNADQMQAALDQQRITISKQKAATSSTSTNTFPAIYDAMSKASDPQAWLDREAPYMTNAELKYAQSLLD